MAVGVVGDVRSINNDGDITSKRMCTTIGDYVTKEIKEKLKAFFAAQFYTHATVHGPDYSTCTGGDLEGFTLEGVGKAIDEFDETKIN